MSAEEFLNTIQQRGMLDEKVLAKLRRQLASRTKKVSPERIAKLLVDRGLLTAFQAQSLLETTGGAGQAGATGDRPGDSGVPRSETSRGDDEELGLAPGFEDELARPKPARPARPVFELDTDDDSEAIDLDDVSPIAPSPPSSVETSGPAMAVPQPPPGGLEEAIPRGSVGHTLGEDEVSVEPAAAVPVSGRGGRGPQWLRRFARRHGKTFRSKKWDSPLMLVGGGTLVVLVLAGIFLTFFLMRGSGDVLFRQAEDEYRRGAYNQSIATYDKFLSRFANHPNASLARVRQRLARLRHAVENESDWGRALAIAKGILPQIKTEEAFAEARPELASLLPEIYAGFVEQAKVSEDIVQAQRLVDAAAETRELIDNSEYLPTSLREPQQARIESIAADIVLVVREIDRDQKLNATVEQMRNATAQGNIGQAYTTRQTLLQQYPRLETNETLRAAVVEIAKKEQELVHPINVDLSPSAQDHARATSRRVFLGHRTTTGTVPSLPKDVDAIAVLLGDAVYGLEASTGRPVWRRYVGYETIVHPSVVTGAARIGALLVDGGRRELVRLDATTGDLVWRLALDESFAVAQVDANTILVATQSGKLLKVEASTGKPTQGVQLPQSLDVAPAVDGSRNVAYQVAGHSTFFAFDAESLECSEVFPLGHDPGTVAVEPVVTRGHVFVAENAGIDYSFLHVLAPSEEGLVRRGRPIRLRGQVVTPMVVSDRRVLLATDRGAVHVFEVDPGGGATPVREIAMTASTAKHRAHRYLLADRDQVWISDMRLAKYDLYVARGELVQKWAVFEGDPAVAPLQRRGNTLFHVRRPTANAGGSSIAAIQDEGDEATHVWETELAVPLAGDVIPEPTRDCLAAVSSRGAVFDIDRDALRRGVVDRPAEQVQAGAQAISFHNGFALSQDRYVFSAVSDPRRLLTYDSGLGDRRLGLVDLDVSVDPGSPSPVAMAGQLIVASRSGQVHLLSVGDSGPVTLPFQPRLAPGSKIQWRRPAVVDHQQGRFVIGDAKGRLYLLAAKSEPSRHLAPLAERELGVDLVSPIAVAGTTGYVVARENRRHFLLSFQTSDLSPAARWDLPGPAVWGPEPVADVVLVATSEEGILCVGSDAKRHWVSPVKQNRLVGTPLFMDDSFVVASMNGKVWRVDAGSGQVLPWRTATDGQGATEELDVGEPLGAGPVAVGRQLILTGRDGTLYITDLPRRPGRET